MHPNFLVFALPRSRTAWLSALMTFKDWTCHHEAAIKMRSIEEMTAFLRRPWTGTAETACALGWRLFEHHLPELRRVVIRRPVEDDVQAMLRVPVDGFAVYDAAKLRQGMTRGMKALDEISARPGVLTLDYADLDRRDACAAIFEHCLPYPLPPGRWEHMKKYNIQKDVRWFLLYYRRHLAAIERFKAEARADLWRLARAGLIQKERTGAVV